MKRYQPNRYNGTLSVAKTASSMAHNVFTGSRQISSHSAATRQKYMRLCNKLRNGACRYFSNFRKEMNQ